MKRDRLAVALCVAAVLSLGVFTIGCFTFRRMEDGFADVI